MKQVVEATAIELSDTQVGAFRNEILTWFRSHGRDLPWRRTRDPYRIMVSEIMLQQTQALRVIPAYEAFLQRFPDLECLARVPFQRVLESWRGLGYNRRALYLHRSAKLIQSERDGQFPETIDGLRLLPGIGPYTAKAIACFAFNAQVAVIETNVKAAIHWLIDPTLSTRLTDSQVNTIADRLLPWGQAWDWNQAMIDFGALRVRKPRRAAGRAQPFRETNRYWRGRILATVSAAESPISFGRLLRELPTERDEYRVRTLVQALECEGLLTTDDLGAGIGISNE